MRVEQTGETIAFAFGDGFVEAHIQVNYDGGDATKFAWIVPVPALPSIEIGSSTFLSALLDATLPTFTVLGTGECSWGGFVAMSDVGMDGHGDPPSVLDRANLGMFEYTVLEGGSAESIGAWLDANGYAQDDAAPTILETYVDEGYLFVAFKLLHFEGIEAVHPIVLRYPGNEPCIPLRLTRIAAAEEMPIRVAVLSDQRVMPSNWRSVELTDVRLDWSTFGGNYDAAVSLAIDEPGADGRAFVTEFAGASAMVSRERLQTDQIDPTMFVDAGAVDVIELLMAQQLADCGWSGSFPDWGVASCTWAHDLVPTLLHRYLPVPSDVPDDDFYTCVSCFADLIDDEAWDGPSFAADLQTQVIAPLDRSRALLGRWPYLTQLYTRVSPHEMTTDPTFAPVEGVPDVARRHLAARDLSCCDEDHTTSSIEHYTLASDRVVEVEDFASWPSWPSDVPWAERISERTPDGHVVTLVDAGAAIDAAVARRWDKRCETRTDSATTSDGLTTGSAGFGDVDDSSTTGLSTSPAASDANAGCGCSSPSPAGAGWTGLLLLVGVRRRRHRNPSPIRR